MYSKLIQLYVCVCVCVYCCLHSKSHPTLVTPWSIICQTPLSMGFPSKSTGVGCHFFFQGIFLTQGWNLHLLHWQAYSLTTEPLRKPIYISIYMYIYVPFQILSPFRLLQDIEYTFLCYTIGPCWLAILYIVVYIC